MKTFFDKYNALFGALITIFAIVGSVYAFKMEIKREVSNCMFRELLMMNCKLNVIMTPEQKRESKELFDDITQGKRVSE